MTTQAMERRMLPMDEAELRLHDTEDGGGRLTGYAAVFDSRSRDLGGFTEIIKPGAFDPALEDSDVRALFNHDPDNLLGREGNGTLSLTQDERGLRYSVELDETQVAQFVRQKVNRGDLEGSSFRFQAAPDGDEFRVRDGELIRELRSIEKVPDVGPVTFPAYDGAKVSARSYRRALETMETIAPMEDRASRPTFEGTEDVSPDWADGNWDRPNLSDHPEADEGDEFGDLSESDQDAIRSRFIEQDGENYADLGNPVVNPSTGRLNRNGVLAARQRPASNGAEEIADELWEEHFEGDDEDRSAYERDRDRLRRLESAL